jgi:hypothetical protein
MSCGGGFSLGFNGVEILKMFALNLDEYIEIIKL